MSQPSPTPEIMSLVAPAQFTWLRVFLSLVVLLIFLLIALFSPHKNSSTSSTRNKSKSSTSSVLLVGSLASGKTALFSKLVYGTAPQSHTSMKENEGVVTKKWLSETDEKKGEKASLASDESSAVVLARPLHVVDIPGHPRLRTRSLAQFLPAADGIIFTIDSTTGLTGKNVRDAGEHLHVVLSLLSLLSSRRASGSIPSLLILLTKSDLLTATSSSSTPTKPKSLTLTLDRAKQSLARELERRRAAGSTGQVSAGAKLEGLEAIPTGSSSSGSKGFINSILTLFGMGQPTVTTSMSDFVQGLPSDEAELLSNDEAFPFEGSFEWEKVEKGLGIEIKWAVASSMSEDKGSEGVSKVWQWVEEEL